MAARQTPTPRPPSSRAAPTSSANKRGGARRPDTPRLALRRWITNTDALIGLGLVALVAAAFWPVWHYPFVILDDPPYVTANPMVRHGLTLDGIFHVWGQTTLFLWHPLTTLSLMLDSTLFGVDHPGVFHVINALLHAGSAVLLFAILRQATGARWRSALAAALFAVHPLRVESVAWIAERKDVLSVFFGLASTLCYVRYARKSGWHRLALSYFWLALSLMSKPTLVTLPVLLMLLDYWPLGRLDALLDLSQPLASRLKRAGWLLAEKAPMFLLGLAMYLTVTAVGRASARGDMVFRDNPALRHANAATVFGRYLVKMVRFDGLSVYYPMPGQIPAREVLLNLAMLAAITAAAAAMAIARPQRWRHLLAGWLWFVVALLPTTGFHGLIGDQSMADRYSYFPSIGLAILVIWSIPAQLAATPGGRWFSRIAATACLGVLLVCTRWQLGYWETGVKLFSHALTVGDSATIQCSLGYELLGDHRLDEAQAHFAAALKNQPDNGEVFRGLAKVAEAQGRADEAIKQWEATLKRDPWWVDAHVSVAALYSRRGQFAEADRHYRRALELEPDNVDALVNRGIDLADAGHPDEAIVLYRHAIRVAPDNADAHMNLAGALMAVNQPQESAAQSAEALRYQPDSTTALFNLAMAELRLGRRDSAIGHLRRVLTLTPHDPDAEAALRQAMAGPPG